MAKIPKAIVEKYNKSVGTVQKIKNTLVAIKALLSSNKSKLAELKSRILGLSSKKGIRGLGATSTNITKLNQAYNQLIVKQKAQTAKYTSLVSQFAKVTAMMDAAKKAITAVAKGAKKVAGAIVGKMKAFGTKYKLFGKKTVSDLGDISDLGVAPLVIAVGVIVALASATASLLMTANAQAQDIVNLTKVIEEYEAEEEEPEAEEEEPEAEEEEPEAEEEEAEDEEA